MDKNADKINFFDFEMTVSDAERLVRWYEQPEAKILASFLASQADVLAETADREVGENPFKSVLERERAIGGKVALKSIQNFPDDIKEAVRQYEEINKKS